MPALQSGRAGAWGWRNELACDAPKSRSRASSRSSCTGFGAITANTAGRRYRRPPPENHARAKAYRNPPNLGGSASRWDEARQPRVLRCDTPHRGLAGRLGDMAAAAPSGLFRCIYNILDVWIGGLQLSAEGCPRGQVNWLILVFVDAHGPNRV